MSLIFNNVYLSKYTCIFYPFPVRSIGPIVLNLEFLGTIYTQLDWANTMERKVKVGIDIFSIRLNIVLSIPPHWFQHDVRLQSICEYRDLMQPGPADVLQYSNADEQLGHVRVVLRRPVKPGIVHENGIRTRECKVGSKNVRLPDSSSRTPLE